MKMKPKEKLASREVDGKLYIVDIEDETLHAFNPSAALIWDGIKKGHNREKIVSRLADEFEVAEAAAMKDAEEFIGTLIKRGLIK